MDLITAWAVTRDQYNRLVDKVEARFEGQPDKLTRKLYRMVVGGYAYLLTVLILALALCIGIVALVIWMPNFATIKIGLIFGVGAFVLLISVLKGCWVRTSPPEGVKLTRDEVPELFVLLDDLREKVADASFDEVLVDGDFNACVVQVPRLGIFGWYRSYLVLGLPLMQALSPDEFRAVLAHEFAHLSNRDGDSGNWLYRTRVSWEKTINSLAEQGTGGSFALIPFFNWFWPRFNAHAFVLSRLFEYRADAAAASFAGKTAASHALQRVEVAGRRMSKDVWAPIFRRVNHEPEAPADVFASIGVSLASPLEEGRHREWLSKSFLRPTDRSDTHPALKDLLRAFDGLPDAISEGGEPEPLPHLEETSAKRFLGEVEVRCIAELDKKWHEGMAEIWKARHEEVIELRKKLGAEEEATTPEKAWEWAMATMDMEGTEAAMPWIGKVLTMNPKHSGARYVEATHLLEQGDARGVGLLETLMVEDESFAAQSLDALRGYYMMIGQSEKLDEIDRKGDDLDEFYAKAEKERQQISPKDILRPHELSEAMLELCRESFTKEKEVSQVHIALKETQHMKTVPMYAVAISIKVPALKLRSDSASAELVGRLLESSPLDGTSLYFVKEKDLKKSAKAVQAVLGSLVYSRELAD